MREAPEVLSGDFSGEENGVGNPGANNLFLDFC